MPYGLWGWEMQLPDPPWHYEIICKRKEAKTRNVWGASASWGRSPSYLHGGPAKHKGEWWGWGDGQRSRQLMICDQEFSNQLMKLVQQACDYFFEDDWKPMQGVPGSQTSDDEVRRRVHQLETGELKREANARNLEPVPLSKLPFTIQRAMIEQVDALAARWQFKILD